MSSRGPRVSMCARVCVCTGVVVLMSAVESRREDGIGQTGSPVRACVQEATQNWRFLVWGLERAHTHVCLRSHMCS